MTGGLKVLIFGQQSEGAFPCGYFKPEREGYQGSCISAVCLLPRSKEDLDLNLHFSDHILRQTKSEGCVKIVDVAKIFAQAAAWTMLLSLFHKHHNGVFA